jgi:hypothetical protein
MPVVEEVYAKLAGDGLAKALASGEFGEVADVAFAAVVRNGSV